VRLRFCEEYLVVTCYIYCTVKGKGHPITGHQAPRGEQSNSSILSQPRRWEGSLVSTTPRLLYPEKDLVTIEQQVGWAPWPVWTCATYLALTGIRSPDRPARSQSLYIHIALYCIVLLQLV
jgi:hypothetical protein